MPLDPCPYCERPYSDARGCDYLDSDPTPLPFGEETAAFADLRGMTLETLNPGHACADCEVMRGKLHHADCLKSECRACHHQFGFCGGRDCDEVWKWSTGETHPERRPAA